MQLPGLPRRSSGSSAGTGLQIIGTFYRLAACQFVRPSPANEGENVVEPDPGRPTALRLGHLLLLAGISKNYQPALKRGPLAEGGESRGGSPRHMKVLLMAAAFPP